MSFEENKQIVRRQFEIINRRDVEGVTTLWANGVLNHGRATDPAGLRKLFRSLTGLYETHEIYEMVGEGGCVAVRTTCSGRHSITPELPVNGGIFQIVAPTGRSHQCQHIHLFKVVGGKLAEHWACRDDLGAAQQIGLQLRPSRD